MSILTIHQGVTAKANEQGARNAIGYSGKLIATTATGKVWRYQSGAWAQVSDAGDNQQAKCLFVTKVSDADVLFASWGDNGSVSGKSGVYRSEDDGTTWSRVIPPVGDTEWGDDTSARAIVEADNGYLFAGAYPKTGDHPNLYRSTDGGVTWAIIKTFSPEKHIHSIYYCPHRELLFVATGDLAGSSRVKYSDDYGETWEEWAGHRQSISMSSDASYIYGTFDNGTERGIWRAADAGGAITTVYAGVASTASWMIDALGDGRVVAFFTDDGGGGKYIATSVDSGENWTVESTAIAVGTFSLPSAYNRDMWDGAYYSGNPFYSILFTNKILASSSGVDWLGGTWKTAAAASVALSHGIEVGLLSDMDDAPLYVCGGVAKGNGYSVASYTKVTPSFASDFETAPTWTSTTGTIDSASTEQAYSGSKSMKATGPSSLALKDVTAAGSGLVFCASGRVYIPSAISGGTYADTLVMRNGAASATIAVRIGTDMVPYVRVTTTPSASYSQWVSKVALTAAQWVKIKLLVYVHASTGYIGLFIDDKLVVFVAGIPTLFGGSAWSTVRYGVNTDCTGVVVYWDDIAVGRGDTDQPSAFRITGTGIVSDLGVWATCDGILPTSAQPCKGHALPIGVGKITVFDGVASAAQIEDAK